MSKMTTAIKGDDRTITISNSCFKYIPDGDSIPGVNLGIDYGSNGLGFTASYEQAVEIINAILGAMEIEGRISLKQTVKIEIS